MFCTACTYSLLMPSSSSTLEVSDLLPEQQLTVSDFFFPIEKPLHFEPRYGQSCAHHCSAEPCKWWAVVQRVPGLGHPPWGNDLALCFDILPVPKPGERPGSCSQQCAGGWLFSVSPSIPVLIPIPPHPSLCPRSPISQPIPAPQHHPVASATRSSSLTPVQPGLCCWDAEMAWFGVWGLGFRLWGFGFGFLWFGVWALGFGVSSPPSGHRLHCETLCEAPSSGKSWCDILPWQQLSFLTECHSNTCLLPKPSAGCSCPAHLGLTCSGISVCHWNLPRTPLA